MRRQRPAVGFAATRVLPLIYGGDLENDAVHLISGGIGRYSVCC